MIWGILIAAGGFAVVYNVLKSQAGKITSKGKMIKNVGKTFLIAASILIVAYLGFKFLIGG